MIKRQAFRFRLREKRAQGAFMRRVAGCRRFVWNHALDEQQARYARGEKYASYVEMAKWLTAWRLDPQTAFLAEAPVHALQEALKSLDDAFRRFFRKEGGYPKPKRRSDTEGFRETDPACFAIDEANARIRLPKIGWMRYRQSRMLEGVARNLSVSRERGGWVVSIQTEVEAEPLAGGNQIDALDRGITNFYATALGERKAPLNAHRTLAHRLRHYQRAVSRRIEAAKVAAGLPKDRPFPKGFRLERSNRLRRAQTKVQRLHAQIGRVRANWLHCESLALAKRCAFIVLEDLNIQGMSASASGTPEMPGRNVRAKAGLNRSILDQGWFEFERQLGYKLAWRGGDVVKVPAAYTSQRCSVCGQVYPENRHGERFRCLHCGYEDHADVNAAKNILAAGHAVLASDSLLGHADVEAMVPSDQPAKRLPARREGGAPCAP